MLIRMSQANDGHEFFAGIEARHDGSVVINARCRIDRQGGYHVVTVAGLALAHFGSGDRMGEAYAMVTLVEQGLASQVEVASAFACSERTVRRNQRRFELGGLSALGRPMGYPKGATRLGATRVSMVNGWKAEGASNREIACRLGVTEKAVRKLTRRLGWGTSAHQLSLGLEPASGADPNLSGSAMPLGAVHADDAKVPGQDAAAGADPNLSGSAMPLGAEHADDAKVPGQDAAAGADPNLSGSAMPLGTEHADDAKVPGQDVAAGADPNLSGSAMPLGTEHADDAKVPGQDAAAGADPNLSGSGTEMLLRSLDSDPTDRSVDRVLACMGILEDAAPLFAPACSVPSVGVLLAIPALVDSGVFQVADDVYGSIGPSFYGLRTTILLLVLMALLRIKRAEGLKEHSPAALGRLVGLDRAPEVKTLRRKIARLAALGRAAEFGHALAAHRVAAHGHAMGFLYVDGHVRAYHGKRRVPKGHLARMRLSMPATTDYWVNDAQGEPLFVVTTEANKSLTAVLPQVLEEVRSLMGDRRVTVVFDRGGWSPNLFAQILSLGFDILTYRKGRSRRLPSSWFAEHKAFFDGHEVSYQLADTNTSLHYGPPNARKRLHLRQVSRLTETGHQTQVITSRRDLSAIEVAYRMFERWRQENFFKYLREEYALDALVDYGIDPADTTRDVPNPKRKQLNAELRKAYVELNQLAALYGAEAFTNHHDARRTLKGFKNANEPTARAIQDALERVAKLEQRRKSVPQRIPVGQLDGPEVVKLRVERKHLTDLLKMVAYQVESELVRLVSPHFRRAEQEARTLVQSALACTGDISLADGELHVALEPLSSPHRTAALASLCEHINASTSRFPGSALRLRFSVQPQPAISPAFPGPRTSHTCSPQPDIRERG